MISRNRETITRVARHLGPHLNEVVFVGGATVELLLTRPIIHDIRVTKDVDFIVEVLNRADYYLFADRLRKLGFREKLGAEHPVCRWTIDDILVDVMPTNEDILGFTNRWYNDAITNSINYPLEADLTVRLVSPVYFLATKLEAFKGRGNDDLFLSHDIEDLLTLLDGRPEITSEIHESQPELQEYLRTAFSEIRKHRDYSDALTGHFPRNPISGVRIAELRDRIEALSQ